MVTETSASLRTLLLGLRSSLVKRIPIRIPLLPLLAARSFRIRVPGRESCFWATRATT